MALRVLYMHYISLLLKKVEVSLYTKQPSGVAPFLISIL